MVLNQAQNPTWSPALVTASPKEGVGSTAFSLNYFKDKGKKAEMSTSILKYCLPLPWFPLICLVGTSFPLSLPPLLTSFHRVCQSWGCPAVQQVWQGKEKVKISLNVTTHMQAVMAHHTLFCTTQAGKLGQIWLGNTGWKRSKSFTWEVEGVSWGPCPELCCPSQPTLQGWQQPRGSSLFPTVPLLVSCCAIFCAVKNKLLLTKQSNKYF